MRKITKINTWKSPKGEFRIYVSFEGCKNQGCYYKSGNYYQPKGTLENMDTWRRTSQGSQQKKEYGKFISKKF